MQSQTFFSYSEIVFVGYINIVKNRGISEKKNTARLSILSPFWVCVGFIH